VIFDSWVHPLVMGLEEHLLTMFRDDFEFHDSAGPSHLGAGHGAAANGGGEQPVAAPAAEAVQQQGWTADAERELMKIPFFVRGKARRNTEAYAANRGIGAITIDTLYEAKAHLSGGGRA
jgi:light-independent protochlorophyllide reductase subunit B